MNRSRHQPQRRLLRTQVIWKESDYDLEDDEYCPISFDVFRTKKFIISVFLAIVVIAAQQDVISFATIIGEQHEVTTPVDATARATQIETVESITTHQRYGVFADRARGHLKEHQRMGQSSSVGGDVNTLLVSSAGVSNKGANDTSLHWDPSELYSMGSMHNTKEIPLPSVLDNLADVDEPFRYGKDVPYFWHTPRTMGQTTKEILGVCVGINVNHTSLTNSTRGIREAKKMQLVEKESVNFIATQYLHEGATLFSENHRGRMFTFIRHPIERAVSMFYYLGVAKHEPTYDPDLQHVTLEMWSRSKRVEHNWLTRFLSNELKTDLTMEHLELAKEVLRQKCIIGLFDEKSETWSRLERFFGWKFYTGKNRECFDRLLNWGWKNKNLHKTIGEDSLAWDLLYKHNELDMILYEYAQLLFEEQRVLFGEGGILVKNNNLRTPG